MARSIRLSLHPWGTPPLGKDCASFEFFSTLVKGGKMWGNSMAFHTVVIKPLDHFSHLSWQKPLCTVGLSVRPDVCRWPHEWACSPSGGWGGWSWGTEWPWPIWTARLESRVYFGNAALPPSSPDLLYYCLWISFYWGRYLGMGWRR